MYYITTNKLTLGKYSPNTLRKLENLLSEISFSALMEAEQDILGLLVTAWDASADSDNPRAFPNLLKQMTSVERHAREPVQVAKAEAKALRKGS